jgi:hypothetical protein
MVKEIYCDIYLQGHLSSRWRLWFAGLNMELLPDGVSRLYGTLPDQAAFYGALECVRNLGLVLVSVVCHSAGEGEKGADVDVHVSV